MGNAVEEVGGAVERIDDPRVAGVFAAARRCPLAPLFADDGMARIGGEDGVDDGVLGLPVDLGDEVVLAFLLDGERIHPIHRRQDDAAGTTGRPQRDVRHRFHESCLGWR